MKSLLGKRDLCFLCANGLMAAFDVHMLVEESVQGVCYACDKKMPVQKYLVEKKESHGQDGGW